MEDVASLERKVCEFSSASPQEASERIQFVMQAHQLQADAAITSRAGVAAADLGDFYQWARESHGGALRGAIEAQVHKGDFSGYSALATRYLADNAPSVAAVKAGGFDTRQHGSEPEVLINGRWMTVKTAAKMGMF